MDECSDSLRVREWSKTLSTRLKAGAITNRPPGSRLRGALRKHEKIGPPPHTVNLMLTSRKLVERFGGTFHAKMSTGNVIWTALRTDEANLTDLVRFGRVNHFSAPAARTPLLPKAVKFQLRPNPLAR